MASSNDLQGKVCLVTGASSGIGKAAALGLARRGATVVLHARSPERGQAALDEIRSASGSRSLHLLTGDLASQAAVRRLAHEVKEQFSELNVLINNAGVNPSQRVLTADGVEMNLAVNYLAPFLLTLLLLDPLKANAPSRVVNMGTWRQPPVHLDDLKRETRFDAMQAYQESKTALTMFTYELARRLAGSGVSVNSVNPGLIRTELGRDAQGGSWLFLTLVRPFMKSAERAADDVLRLAVAPELEGVNGKFFAGQTETRTSPETYDTGVSERLWQLS